MKSGIDFRDRVLNILSLGGLKDEIKGNLLLRLNGVENESVVITGLPVDHSPQIVDGDYVSVNLFIQDIEGETDFRRFRQLIGVIHSIIEQFNDYKGDFVQYLKDKNGNLTTHDVSANDEYFWLEPVFSDGPLPDPERPGYSYYTVRLLCSVEK